MIKTSLLHRFLALLLALGSGAVFATERPALLPSWEMLEFEEKAFWAVANSKLEINADQTDDGEGLFVVTSSVPGNSEEISMTLDMASGQLLRRERLSQGKKDRRFKSYDYRPDILFRERREPMADASAAQQSLQPTGPDNWKVTSETRIPYPETNDVAVITDPYVLVLLAGRLQSQPAGSSMEVLVNTDQNFYRVHLTRGNGIPVNASYEQADGTAVTRTFDTVGVVVKAEPEGALSDKDDFSLLGLKGNIILLYDEASDLPLQIRGDAPRIGTTEINLKSVALRTPIESQDEPAHSGD